VKVSGVCRTSRRYFIKLLYSDSRQSAVALVSPMLQFDTKNVLYTGIECSRSISNPYNSIYVTNVRYGLQISLIKAGQSFSILITTEVCDTSETHKLANISRNISTKLMVKSKFTVPLCALCKVHLAITMKLHKPFRSKFLILVSNNVVTDIWYDLQWQNSRIGKVALNTHRSTRHCADSLHT